MSSFINKIQNKTNPAVHNRRDFATIALVTATDEINNVCSIEFIDKDGYKSNKDNVSVKISTPNLISWFPTVNEYVNISIENDIISVVSKAEGNYATDIRAKLQLKKDIYSSSFGGTLGGNIF